jgi:hypothetical protein
MLVKGIGKSRELGDRRQAGVVSRRQRRHGHRLVVGSEALLSTTKINSTGIFFFQDEMMMNSK